MCRFLWLVGGLLLLLAFNASARAQERDIPTTLASNLNEPAHVAVGSDGRIYVTEMGDLDEKKGRIVVLDKGKAVPFAAGFDVPGPIVSWQNWLFVGDFRGVWRIERKGKVDKIADIKSFDPFKVLTSFAVDEQGTLYVAAVSADRGAIYKIDAKRKVTPVADAKRGLVPDAVVLDGMSHLIVNDRDNIIRMSIADRSAQKIASGGGALGWDLHGRMFFMEAVSEKGKERRLLAIPRPGEKPITFCALKNPFGMCFDATTNKLLVVQREGEAGKPSKEGKLVAIPISIPGWAVDDTLLPLQTAIAFPNLKWTGWKGFTDDGKVEQLRPLILTHAGDGSDRVFVGIQQGTIHVFPNDQKAAKTEIFLDIRSRVRYFDNENEEGFLGLAFHPKYKTNGEFFVFYTSKKEKMTNVLSRFRVSKDDPNKADPESEEVLLKIKRPYWNHDGGTICFGPDGYLYVAVGDGGSADDPKKNGQNLKTLLAKVLRIDVDNPDKGEPGGVSPGEPGGVSPGEPGGVSPGEPGGVSPRRNYGIPKDNPFVNRKDALPEIWAYGLRNVWRMAFDKKTGKLWASDVGQNLYEEIDIIEKGGNYGWSKREGLHPFGPDGLGANKDMIDPIWEYHHDVGKSLTGGHVYRGKRLPELDGAYLYGDFVTAKIWALWYDEGKKRVVANRPIRDPNVPILSFGEDERGEVYFLTNTVSGKGIYHFVKSAQK